jgi:hypothetical protein
VGFRAREGNIEACTNLDLGFAHGLHPFIGAQQMQETWFDMHREIFELVNFFEHKFRVVLGNLSLRTLQNLLPSHHHHHPHFVSTPLLFGQRQL